MLSTCLFFAIFEPFMLINGMLIKKRVFIKNEQFSVVVFCCPYFPIISFPTGSFNG